MTIDETVRVAEELGSVRCANRGKVKAMRAELQELADGLLEEEQLLRSMTGALDDPHARFAIGEAQAAKERADMLLGLIAGAPP